MAVTTITDDAVDNLRIVEFFDPQARFNYGRSDELSLVSSDGYELVLRGDDFDFNANSRPTDGVIKEALLYEPDGDLVGRIGDFSFPLVDYYDTVVADGRPGFFVSSLLAGADTIRGGSADDYLEGYGGGDVISGGAGFDLLVGDDGDDSIDGGNGGDDIDGSAGDDVVSGGDGRDLILGFDGDDDLSGDAGDDTVEGEAGDDVIAGSGGFDRLFGGLDDDEVSGGAQDDRVEGGRGDDRVEGGAGDDFGGGGIGADTVSGGDGRDELFGDAGDDELKGQAGSDSINGGAGDDEITGGPGRDFLFGGDGDDRFVFRNEEDGVDDVDDFSRGDDLLVFRADGFDRLDADFDLVANGDPEASAGRPTFLFDTTSRDLFYDGDGDGAGEALQIAHLDGVGDLTKSDFLIV
jgi:Ca2+-binding RTX toxin-like protein